MTTICAVKNNGKTAIAGDGQVTMSEKFIMKGSAQKVRRIYDDQVIIGFAGGVADAFTLQEWLEEKLKTYSGNLKRAAVELAQDWRKDPTLQKLEALLIAIGSGGNFAQAAATPMIRHSSDMTSEEIAKEAINIASGIDVYTNQNIITDKF